MMHPDEIEEMDYQANARYDYLSEAFGEEARLLARQAEEDYYWDFELGIDIRELHGPHEQWSDSYCQNAVKSFLAFIAACDKDDIPF